MSSWQIILTIRSKAKMHNTPSITLIVPVYNGERYAENFLESLSAQTYFPDQVLFVNDGSTDNSLTILTEFAKNRFEVQIISQANQGAGKARNRGIAEALGDIVGFADFDDIMDPHVIAKVVESFAKEESLDVVVVNGQSFWEDQRPAAALITKTKCEGTVDGQIWLTERLRAKNFEHYAWLYYVKRAFIKNNELTFSEGIGHEDVLWVTELVLYAKRLRFINQSLYYYRQRLNPLEGVPLRNRVADLESAIVNTLGIGRLMQKHKRGLSTEAFEQLREEFVSGGCSKSHEFGRIDDRGVRRHLVSSILGSGLLSQLWEASRGFNEKFRVVKSWIRIKAAAI